MSLNDPTPGDSDPVHNPAGDGVIISDDAVAQGRYGRRTFMILAVSLVLVVLVLFAIFGMHARRLGDKGPGGAGQEGADKASQSQVFNAPEPSPKQAPPGAPSTTATGSTTSGS